MFQKFEKVLKCWFSSMV